MPHPRYRWGVEYFTNPDDLTAAMEELVRDRLGDDNCLNEVEDLLDPERTLHVRPFMTLTADLTDVERIQGAIRHLKAARDLLSAAHAPRAADAVRSSLKSAEGAQAHAFNKLALGDAPPADLAHQQRVRANAAELREPVAA